MAWDSDEAAGKENGAVVCCGAVGGIKLLLESSKSLISPTTPQQTTPPYSSPATLSSPHDSTSWQALQNNLPVLGRDERVVGPLVGVDGKKGEEEGEEGEEDS